MYSTIRKLGFQTIIYGMSGILTQAAGFFLLPLYTHYLTPADYGAFELVNVFFNFANQIFMLGLGTAMFRSFYDADTFKEKKIVVSTTANFLVIYTFLLTLPLYIFSDRFVGILIGGSANSLWLRLVVGTVFINSLMQLPLYLLRVEERAWRYLIIDVAVFLTTLILNIIFIVRFSLGVLGLLESRLIATLIGFILGAHVVIKYFSLTFSFKEIKKQLVFGIPLIVSNFAYIVFNLSDRYFLKSLTGLNDLGIYSVSYKFANIFTFFVLTPFSIAWGSALFSIYKQKDAKEIYSSITNIFLIISCFSSSGFLCLAKK